jgi:hypothetical protein
MVSSVQHGESREYYVGVVGYYIEGVPHSATGVSLNQRTPPDITLTDESVTFTAFFPPHMVDVSIVMANGIIQQYVGEQAIDLVPVRLEVKLIDIWTVAEFIKGKQHDLFLDPETVESRLLDEQEDEFSMRPALSPLLPQRSI